MSQNLCTIRLMDTDFFCPFKWLGVLPVFQDMVWTQDLPVQEVDLADLVDRTTAVFKLLSATLIQRKYVIAGKV